MQVIRLYQERVNPIAAEAVGLARFGFCHKLICQKLDLTPNQLSRILKAYAVRVRDYREGKNEWAKNVIASFDAENRPAQPARKMG